MVEANIPHGTTMPRAPPGEAISAVVEKFGLHSQQTARAYASAANSSCDNLYTPIPHSYWNATASMFHLRSGVDYKKNKEKSPSAAALYDLHSFDIVESPNTLSSVEDKFELPDIPGITDIDTGHDAVPPMFVVTTSLPSEEPSMLGSKNDGRCFVAVFYLIISEATLEELKDLKSASPAVKLFVEWCMRAETDAEFRGRFKAMAILDDIKKLG